MFALTPEQEEIQRAARAFVRERLPTAHLRALRDARDPLRLSRAVWKDAAALGWAGILVPEEHGGVGLGMAEIGIVLEECGRMLSPTPLVATSVLGVGVLRAAPLSIQAELLPRVAEGELLLAVAFEEDARFRVAEPRTTATRDGAGWRLDGEKVHVLDGAAADHLIVSAGDALYLVARDAPGLTVLPLAMVDSRGAARVRLDGVLVPESRRIAGLAALHPVLDRATAALAAEMLGGAEEVFARTIAYLKERTQFGVPIGSFQALKHRAAHLYCAIELTRSVVRAALVALDTGAPDAAVLVSAAKAKASDTFVHVANEAVQMHGGIGVTDELDVGFYLKRARVAEQTFGNANYHRDRFARLQHY
jgi:alkylation response protein AidB-like acyl-CoA dehydrogenase